MSTPRDFLDYLNDILDAIGKAEAFVAEMDYDQFAADDKTVFAVIRAIEIMGEAAKHIPPDVRKRHLDIPWTRVAGMRDKVIHGYFGVNLQTVWKAATQDAPFLKPLVTRAVEQETRAEKRGNA
ncbi:MAG: DUF86 domain-containing protein [Planctomycetes bacterium]|nr:DUF86 domain-containing protein [Planctomycetota bacterium]